MQGGGSGGREGGGWPRQTWVPVLHLLAARAALLCPLRAALAGAAGSISCERTRSDAVVLLLCRVAVPCDTELMGRVLGLA